MTINSGPAAGTPDAVGAALAPYAKGLLVVAVAAACLVFVLALSAPYWAAGLESYEWFRWLADTALEFLQRFYHEPEMDIV